MEYTRYTINWRFTQNMGIEPIDKNNFSALVADIEESLRCVRMNLAKEGGSLPPDFNDFEKAFESFKEERFALQKYILDLLEIRGPKRPSGNVDTVCFYEKCCISATTWSNFINGKYSEDTIKKIIAGLECNRRETERALELAGFTLTNSKADRIILAAIMSGHHNTQDMYVILDFYSKQYPTEVKNYYKNDI